MNKLIKLILQYKEYKNCNEYSNEVIFEDIYIELEYLIKSYVCKVTINNRDDFNQGLLSVLYKVLQVFELKNNIDYEKVNSIKITMIYNIDDIIKIYDNKYFNAFVSKYKLELYEFDFQNVNYIDLLFYNRALSCLVAFELKIEKFRPEFISKMDFYLEALDRKVKRENENPSVGVILCAGKDEEVVEFAMSRSLSPTMVSQYTLKLIDKKLLQNKLKEITNIVEENNENNG